jgi:hypothetical protein
VERIAVVEEVARDATEGPWYAEHPEGRWGNDPEARLVGRGKILGTLSNDYNGHLNADHIALNGPDVVLRRCAADRKLLKVHKPRGVDWSTEDRTWGDDPNVCEGCGQAGNICQDWVTEHANDCPVLLAIAEGYGLTETELAFLDRPQARRPASPVPSVLGEAVAKLWGAAVTASLRDGLVLHTTLEPEQPEPSPREKALRILGPELRTIPLYRPPEDPTP